MGCTSKSYKEKCCAGEKIRCTCGAGARHILHQVCRLSEEVNINNSVSAISMFMCNLSARNISAIVKFKFNETHARALVLIIRARVGGPKVERAKL